MNDFFVCDARSSGKLFVDCENYKSNVLRAVILGKRVALARGAAVAKVLLGRSVGSRASVSGLQVDVDIKGCERRNINPRRRIHSGSFVSESTWAGMGSR